MNWLSAESGGSSLQTRCGLARPASALRGPNASVVISGSFASTAQLSNTVLPSETPPVRKPPLPKRAFIVMSIALCTSNCLP